MNKFSYDDVPHNHSSSLSVRMSANKLSERFKKIDDKIKSSDYMSELWDDEELYM